MRKRHTHNTLDQIVDGALRAAIDELTVHPETGRRRKGLPRGITRQTVRDWVNRAIGATEHLNRSPLSALFEKWRKVTTYMRQRPAEYAKSPNQFGWVLVMQAMGHGVSVDDDGETGIEVASRELVI